MASEYRKITDLIFEPKGTHNPSVSYNIKDTVTNADGSQVYFAIQNVPAGTALTNTAYWKKQIDLSASKNAMDTAAANAETQTDAVITSAQGRVDDLVEEAANSVAQMQDYTSEYSTRVHGESAVAYGNPMEIYPDEGSLLKPVTEIKVKQEGEGDPYPAGGGKNLLPFSNGNWTITSAVEFSSPYIVISKKLPANQPLVASVWFTDGTEHTDHGAVLTLRDASYNIIKAPGFNRGEAFTLTETEAENIATYGVYFNDYGASLNLGKTIAGVQLEIGTMQTAFAPHENIRPIIGYDALNLTRCGKNLFSKQFMDNTALGIAYVDGPVISYSFNGRSAMMDIPLAPGTYTISGPDTICVYVYYDESRIHDPNLTHNNDVQLPYTFTLRKPGYFAIHCLSDEKNIVQLERGSVATAYEPPVADVFNAQIGQTVYGGRMDWNTGEMLVTHGLYECDGSDDEPWGVYGALNGFTLQIPQMIVATAEKTGACSIIPTGYDFDANKYAAMFGYNSNIVYFMGCYNIWGVSTLDGLKALLAENPIQIVYRLAEPFTIQLTPHQILALKGKNTIYGDADLTVEYYKPISSLVDRYNALVEATTDPFEVSGNPVTCQTIGHQELEVVTEFSPKQEGSGDPYPAGGGKNLFGGEALADKLVEVNNSAQKDSVNKTIKFDTTAGETDTIFSDFKPNTQYTFIVYGNNSGSGHTHTNMTAYYTDGTNTAIYFSSGTENSYGLMVTTAGKTVRELKTVEYGYVTTLYYDKCGVFEGVVGLEDFAPYENIRPIIGYDALELTRTGKNIFGGDALKDAFLSKVPNTTHDAAAGTITYSSEHVSERKIFDQFKPNTQYTIILYGFGVGTYKPTNLKIVYTDGSSDGFSFDRETGYSNAVLITQASKSVKYLAGIWVTGTTTLKYDLCGIFEGVLTVDDFEPYNGDTHISNIGQTVYGGRMDWNTGKLYCNLCKITFDGVTLGRKVDRTDPGVTHYAYIDAANMPYPIKPYGLCISNKTTGTIMLVLGFGLPESLTGCVPGDDELTVAAKYNAVLKAWYDAGDPLEFVYEMAEPFVVQLTPKQILALQSVSTFYGDGDSITVAGRQPKHIAIEERVAALESAILNL